MTTASNTGTSQAAYADNDQAQTPSRLIWARRAIADQLHRLDEAKKNGRSERDFEAESGPPRSTFRHWDERRRRSGVDPTLATFMESPAGAELLHQLVVAALFVFTLRGPDGLRLVSEFLDMSGLDRFVAASYGSVQKLVVQMETLVVEFGAEQRKKLAKEMRPRSISVCEDETFHPEICLVAIEPVSNFILLEGYAEKRDAETWTKDMKPALADLPVTVIQVTSDGAKALKAHAEEAFGAHPSPDLFHPQHDISRAMSFPLAGRVRDAEQVLEQAMTATEQIKVDRTTYGASTHGPGRPPNFDARAMNAKEAEDAAKKAVERAVANQADARQAVRSLSQAYHPYALTTGELQSAEVVASLLAKSYAEIRQIASVAELSDRASAGIAKAERVVGAMVDTIRFTHEEITRRLAGLDVAEEIRKEIEENLVPALYLRRVAARTGTAEVRRTIEATADGLLANLYRFGSPFLGLPVPQRSQLELQAMACADIFQRSSSCVEGRNGQLSLFHHGLHKLSGRKLGALTVVHNYFIMRVDGTTAAERFFGAAPDDLFAFLLKRMPLPSRPAKKRSPKRIARTRGNLREPARDLRIQQ